MADLARTVREGGVDALLISAERLANDSFVQEVLLPIAGEFRHETGRRGG